MNLNSRLPEVTFKTRIRDEAVGGHNPYRWLDVSTADLFEGRRCVIFSLPGAFTPTCSNYQLPGYEKKYDAFKSLGIDEVFVISVNDSFVMNKWLADLNIVKVKPIPDGSADFTRLAGMLVKKDNLGFGFRSWRYAAVVNDGLIEQWFEEPGRVDDCEGDPYGVTSPEAVLAMLEA
jgi:peroxiredoxin